jgi:hypothetical protein
MALKIFTEAKPFLKADMKPFDITEMELLQQPGSIQPKYYQTMSRAFWTSPVFVDPPEGYGYSKTHGYNPSCANRFHPSV